MKYLILGAAFIAGLVIMFGQSIERVDAKCTSLPNPPRVNDGLPYQAGEYQYTPGYKAVFSNIFNYDPYVSSLPHPFTGRAFDQASLSYVMFANGPGDKYVQVGWVEHPKGLRYTFEQHTNSNGTWDTWLDTSPPTALPEGQSSNYAIWDDNVLPGYWTIRAGNGEPPPSILYVPKLFTAGWAYMSSEITSASNQLPGGAQTQYRETFQGNHLYDPYWAFTWFDVSEPYHYGYNDWPAEFTRYDYAYGSFAVWDNRCAW